MLFRSATGSIGRAVTELLALQHPKALILIGRTPAHLAELENVIKARISKTDLIISTDIAQIQSADIVIVATASPEVLIRPEYLKQQAIIYDVSQPQNISPDIAQKRPDVLVIDGGLVSTPGINYHFNFGCPKEVAFACLAETMLLAAQNTSEGYSIGAVDFGKIDRITQIARNYHFTNFFLRHKPVKI